MYETLRLQMTIVSNCTQGVLRRSKSCGRVNDIKSHFYAKRSPMNVLSLIVNVFVHLNDNTFAVPLVGIDIIPATILQTTPSVHKYLYFRVGVTVRH